MNVIYYPIASQKKYLYPIKFLKYSRSTENDIFPLTFMVESAH